MPDERSARLLPLVEGDPISIPRPISYNRNRGGRVIATFVKTYVPRRGVNAGKLMVEARTAAGRKVIVDYWRVKLFVDEKRRREAAEIEELIEETKRDN